MRTIVALLWHHKVESLEEANININWVGTKKSDYVDSITMAREIELLKFALLFYKFTGRTKFINTILGAGREGYIENFAGVGWSFIDNIAKDISQWQVIKRIIKELTNLPSVIKDRKEIKRKLKIKPLDSLSHR